MRSQKFDDCNHATSALRAHAFLPPLLVDSEGLFEDLVYLAESQEQRDNGLALVLDEACIKTIEDVRKWFERFEKVLHHEHYTLGGFGRNARFDLWRRSVPANGLESEPREAGPAFWTGPSVRQGGLLDHGVREDGLVHVQGSHPVGFCPDVCPPFTLCVLRRGFSV